MLLYEMLAGRSPFDIAGASENPDQNTEDYLFQGKLKLIVQIKYFNIQSIQKEGNRATRALFCIFAVNFFIHYTTLDTVRITAVCVYLCFGFFIKKESPADC